MPSRYGATPYSRQGVTTVLWSIRNRDASNREDQWVTPSFFGGGRSVAATTARW